MLRVAKNGKPLKVGEIAVTFTIVKGPQQKFGKVDLVGSGCEPGAGCAGR